MAKYSFEFKMKVVNEYLQGKLGYRLLSKKYHIPSDNVLREWVAVYRENDSQALQRSRQKKTYSFQFKQHAVELYLSTESSYNDLALSLGINTPSILTLGFSVIVRSVQRVSNRNGKAGNLRCQINQLSTHHYQKHRRRD